MWYLNRRQGWLLWFFALAFAGSSAIEGCELQQLLQPDPKAKQAWADFLGKIEPLASSKVCSLVPLFWEQVDVVEGEAMSLGILGIERSDAGAEIPVQADVLSILMRHHEKVDQARIWMRTYSQHDEGWKEVGVADGEIHIPFSDSLFRGCTVEIVPVSAAFWADPCRGRANCESQPFLWIEETKTHGSAKWRGVPARSVLEQVPLGADGLARWLLESGYEAEEPGNEPGASASGLIWKSSIWLAGQSDPVMEHVFSSEAPASPSPRGSRAEPNAVPSEAATPRVQAGVSACNPKIFAPRAHSKDKAVGFNWKWEGLPGAKVSIAGKHTDPDGCLRLEQPLNQGFKVWLENKHLSIRKMENPSDVISTALAKEGPFVFVEPGGAMFEVLVAANAFGWANQGLREFDKTYPWLSSQVEDLAVHQTQAIGQDPCVGYRASGRIYLPLTCQAHDGFVAKGLCRDVVVHELTHELMGSLVGRSTGGRLRVLESKEVNEALASFFALYLKGRESQFLYAPACQNDEEAVGQGDGIFNERSLLSALALMAGNRNQQDPIHKILAKLLILATFYGWEQDPHQYLDAFFDFASDKAQLEDATLRPICETFRRHAGVCDRRCPSDFLCSRLSNFELEGDELLVRGTFLGTPMCQTYKISIQGNGGRVEALPENPQSREHDRALGRFSSLAPVTPPFDVVLEPVCSAAPPSAERNDPQQDVARLRIVGLPWKVLRASERAGSFMPAQALVAGSSNEPRQLVVQAQGRFEWLRRESGSETLKTNPQLDIRPGFTVSQRGRLQGWTTAGQQVTIRPAPQTSTWRATLGDPWSPSDAQLRAAPRPLSERLVSDDPRLELFDVDAFGITLGTWPEDGQPQIFPLPFDREIDPASLEIGYSSEGPVFSVAERHPRAPRTYALRNGRLPQVEGLVAVYPLETPALSFRRNHEEVTIELLENSACHAPPYVRWVEDRLIALSCDGVVAAYRLDKAGAVHRDWSTKVGGILVPGAATTPIQLGKLHGQREADRALVLGPFRQGRGAEAEDQVALLDLATGRPVYPTYSIRSSKPIQGAPAVIDWDDDGFDEIVVITDDVELWDPKTRPPLER